MNMTIARMLYRAFILDGCSPRKAVKKVQRYFKLRKKLIKFATRTHTRKGESMKK